MSTRTGTTSVKVLLHATYFLSGVATVLIGQVLPILAKRFALGDLELSYFFPAQFAGSVTGTLASSWFGKRDRYFQATVLGSALMVGGLLLMNAGQFEVCLAAFLLNGIGIGLTLPALNMLVLEMNRDGSAAALSVLNFCWGFGAIVCKPFVDAFSTTDSLGLTTFVLAPALVVTLLPLIPSTLTERSTVNEAIHDDTEIETVSIWSTPAAWLIALFNFIHVGFESGIGGWLTTYTSRVPGEPLAPWISPILLYFSFFVIGRGIAPILFRSLSVNVMLFLGLGLILTGLGILLNAGTVIGLSIGALIAGFGTSWVFPTNIARFSETFGPQASRRATPLFIAGTAGAALSTSLIGFVSSRSGSLQTGMYVLLFGVILLLIVQIVLANRSVRSA